MRTITPELTALLRSRFQAAGSGFAARLEVDEPVTSGETTDVNLLVGTVTDGGGGRAWSDPEKANDGSVFTFAHADAAVDSGPQTIHSIIKTDLGAPISVAGMSVRGADLAADDPLWLVEHSSDGLSWTAVTGYSHVFVDDLSTMAFDSVSARYWRLTYDTSIEVGLHYVQGAVLYEWEIVGASIETTYATHSYKPKRINLNRNLRMGPDQAEIELQNEALALAWGPTSIFPTNSRCRVYQWFGDVANEVLTFTGVIDKIADSRDPLTTALSCRSMAGPILVDQTFSTTAPQETGEAGVARTEDNGVYVSKEVDYIAGDILERAGWPSDLIDVADTSFVLDEFIVDDGATWWDTLARLAGFVAYDLWDDEDGVIHLATLGSAAGVDDALTADYAYEIGIA